MMGLLHYGQSLLASHRSSAVCGSCFARLPFSLLWGELWYGIHNYTSKTNTVDLTLCACGLPNICLAEFCFLHQLNRRL